MRESLEIVEKLPACGLRPFEQKISVPIGQHAAGEMLWGYRDAAGKVVVAPRFRFAGPFADDGLAPVGDTRYAGYVGCAGEAFEVMPTLDSVEAARAARRAANDDAQTDEQDEEGTESADAAQQPLDDRRLEPPYRPEPFRDGLVRYANAGYLNRRGQIVIPNYYDYGSPFCDGIAKVGDLASAVGGGGEPYVELILQSSHYIDRSGARVAAPANRKPCGGENF